MIVHSERFSVETSASTVDIDMSLENLRGHIGTDTMFLEPTDEVGVGRLLNETVPKRSAGYDGISCFAIKKFEDLLAFPVTLCVSQCLEEEMFPMTLTPRVMFGNLEIQRLEVVRYLSLYLDECLDHST